MVVIFFYQKYVLKKGVTTLLIFEKSVVQWVHTDSVNPPRIGYQMGIRWQPSGSQMTTKRQPFCDGLVLVLF